MNRAAPSSIVIAVIISLLVGGIAGFFLGIVSTRAGKAFVRGLVEEEQKAEISHPKRFVRERFEVQYPSNWNMDVNDEDYDPDHMFSIDSPGNAFVMFAIGNLETKPEDNLEIQIGQFKKLMSNPAIDKFEGYGRLTGKGATMKGKIMGISTTTKLFAYHLNDLTVMITQQCPDEDLRHAQAGLSLIENTFSLIAH